MDASNIHPLVPTLTSTWSSLFNRNGDRWQCLNTANVLSIVYGRMKIGCGLLEWNVTTSRRKEPSLCQLNYSSSPVISSTRLGWRMTDAMGFCRLIAMKLSWWPGTWQQRQCWAQWSCRYLGLTYTSISAARTFLSMWTQATSSSMAWVNFWRSVLTV